MSKLVLEIRNSRNANNIAFLCALLLSLCALWHGSARSVDAGAPPDPTPPMSRLRDRLAPPLMPAHPTQADLGAEVYYQICMTCHGDQGQGLTEEFRSLLGPPDDNCWRSKCHAANHPPGGFVFPKYVPAVVGAAIPARFPTALDLYHFIKTQMPYNNPGGLQDEAYWQLTAFLVRANGDAHLPVTLNAENAASVQLRPTTRRFSPWLIGSSVGLLLFAGIGGWLIWRRSHGHKQPV